MYKLADKTIDNLRKRMVKRLGMALSSASQADFDELSVIRIADQMINDMNADAKLRLQTWQMPSIAERAKCMGLR